ncbi:hypothetical protein [Streptomyces sp. NPDC056240]|uniref:hypothetical protein n=1 Tax=Streptomyces sp. NPDC056240 TaxID=3345759 RepID=UPI0035DECE9B
MRTLGYRRAAEFIEKGVLIEVVLSHPAGGPHLALRPRPRPGRGRRRLRLLRDRGARQRRDPGARRPP